MQRATVLVNCSNVSTFVPHCKELDLLKFSIISHTIIGMANDLSINANIETVKRVLAQELEKALIAKDGIYFCEKYLKVFETRRDMGMDWKPMVFWPKQREYWNALHDSFVNSHNLAVEKSRDVAGTYTPLAYGFWAWLTIPNFTLHIGSRKEEEVDKANRPNTIFAKLDGFLNALPEWLLPQGFVKKLHRTNLALRNPELGSAITGEGCTPDFARSNRASIIMLDEYAAWDFDVLGFVASVSPTVWVISTVKGREKFFRTVQQYKKYGWAFFLDWWDNPNHTQEWFEEQQKRYTDPAIFAQEILRDHTASVKGRIYPGIEDCPVGEYRYNSNWPLYICWDFGISDKTAILFLQRDPNTGYLYLIDEVMGSDKGIEFYIPFVPGKSVEQNSYVYTPEEEKKINRHQRWHGFVEHYGDPTGDQRGMATGKSAFNVMAEYGIRPRCNVAKWRNMQLRVQMARNALKRLHIDKHCVNFFDQMTQYRIPERSEESQSTAKPNKAIHASSHFPTAFEAFCITEPPRIQERPSDTITYHDPWGMAS